MRNLKTIKAEEAAYYRKRVIAEIKDEMRRIGVNWKEAQKIVTFRKGMGTEELASVLNVLKRFTPNPTPTDE